MRLFRIQHAVDGRGPFRPGFSRYWREDRQDLENLPPFFVEWPHILDKMTRRLHYGCACASVEQLRRWFTPGEYFILSGMGFHAVELQVDVCLAESKIQSVFGRKLPLREHVSAFDLYA